MKYPPFCNGWYSTAMIREGADTGNKNEMSTSIKFQLNCISLYFTACKFKFEGIAARTYYSGGNEQCNAMQCITLKKLKFQCRAPV